MINSTAESEIVTFGDALTELPDVHCPNISLVRTVLMLFNTQNMDVERGFSQMNEILTKKRQRMSQKVYREVKIIKRHFPDLAALCSLSKERAGLWEIIYPYLQSASKEFTKQKEVDKINNTEKKRVGEEMRKSFGIPEIEKGLMPLKKKRKLAEKQDEVQRAIDKLNDAPLDLQGALDTE